jgi:hypothetical protein
MYTANGEWVIAKPDEASWDKFQQTQKVAADQAKELEADKEVMRARGLECSIDHKMFSDPVKTPCCGQIYCRTCIENALIDSDFLCPNCGEQCLLESLESDVETLDKLKAFQEEMKSEKQKKQAEEANKKSPSAVPNSPAKSTQSSGSRPGSANGKKRPADEELENSHKPTGPSEMKRSGSKEGTPVQPAQTNAAKNNVPNAAPPMPARLRYADGYDVSYVWHIRNASRWYDEPHDDGHEPNDDGRAWCWRNEPHDEPHDGPNGHGWHEWHERQHERRLRLPRTARLWRTPWRRRPTRRPKSLAATAATSSATATAMGHAEWHESSKWHASRSHR